MKHQNHKDHQHSNSNNMDMAGDFLKRFIIVSFLLIPLLLLSKTALSFFSLSDFALRKYFQLSIASAIFYFSLVFFQHARHEVRMKKYGMMTLVSLAVGAGFFFSAGSTFIPAFKGVEFYLEISTLIWILLFGHFLEAKSSSAAGNALQEVAKLLPKQAHLLKSGKISDIDIVQLKKGDLVLVKPGEKVPADGLIVKGGANIDESLISGESKPVAKKKNDQVVAGSICLDGVLEIKLTRVGKNSTIGQIQNLISHAQETKPKAQKVADKAAGLLTLVALATSILTILVWFLIIGKPIVFALTLAITVLVIACPHALGLAIPTVSTIATSLAVKNGVFLKDMGKLEVVKDIDYVVFDKTGTLTLGKPSVRNLQFMKNLKNIQGSLGWILPSNMTLKTYLASLLYSLELKANHPIATEVAQYLHNTIKIRGFSVESLSSHAGKGISGKIDKHTVLVGTKRLMEEQKIMFCAELENLAKDWLLKGNTVSYMAIDGKHFASFSLSDQIKPESKEAIEKLHKLNIKTAMLTGDNKQVAEMVSSELNIDEYFAEVLPEDKYKHIKKLQEQGNKVMMVGDGVNDAPALTQADVGIAVGTGTDVAVESGDIVLTRNNPVDIVRLTVLGKKVYRKMIENLIWATGYNIIAIPAAAGVFATWGFFLKPEVGAIMMSLSSVVVVINALTLKRARLEIN